jgi:hypothetical protein
VGDKGSQVQILSARLKTASDLRNAAQRRFAHLNTFSGFNGNPTQSRGKDRATAVIGFAEVGCDAPRGAGRFEVGVRMSLLQVSVDGGAPGWVRAGDLVDGATARACGGRTTSN